MANQQYDIFIGCYGDEKEELIHWYNFDSTGRFTERASFSGIANPSFLDIHPSEDWLYAVSETEEGETVSLQIGFEDFSMAEKNRQPAKGWAPCYIEASPAGYLFTANFGEGSMIIQRLLADGKIGDATDVKDYSKQAESRGRESHPHSLRNVPGTNKYMAADLGMDSLYLYEFNEEKGELTSIKEVSNGSGTGPRHFDFHPSLPIVYVINELNSSIIVYRFNEEKDDMACIQKVGTLPEGFSGENYCADIHVAPCGSFLYGSNRGHHSIAAFAIGEDGTLELIGITPSGGEWPRNFAVTPDGKHILAANEHSNSLNVLEIREDGSLQATDESISVSRPVCVKVIDRTNRP